MGRFGPKSAIYGSANPWWLPESQHQHVFLSSYFWKIFTCLHFLYPKLSHSSPTTLLLQQWSFDGVGEENPSLILLLLQDTTSAC